jgi:hypothetical protein
MPISKQQLSGSTNGRGIKIVATATAGTLLHTAVSETDQFDEVWIYLWNSHSADVLVTLELGGVTDPDDIVEVTIPFQQGLYLVVPGIPYSGGVAIRAFAATANVVVASGFVNRVDQS